MDRLCRLLLMLTVLLAAYSLVILVLRAPGVAVVAAVLGVGSVVARRRSYSGDVYGDARWCSEDDARRAGML
jgi:hypothetical protein